LTADTLVGESTTYSSQDLFKTVSAIIQDSERAPKEAVETVKDVLNRALSYIRSVQSGHYPKDPMGSWITDTLVRSSTGYRGDHIDRCVRELELERGDKVFGYSTAASFMTILANEANPDHEGCQMLHEILMPLVVYASNQ
jgi:hypothetical protein